MRRAAQRRDILQKLKTGRIAIENGQRAVVVDRATDGKLTTKPASFSDGEATRPAHQQTAIDRVVTMPRWMRKCSWDRRL
jgi:hypothetical protein